MRFLLLILLLTSTHSFSQAFEKDQLLVELGMGFPNLSFFRSTNSFSGRDLFSNTHESIHKSRGQFIASSEFLLTHKIGFELGLHYGNYYDYYENTQETYVGGVIQTETYFYEQKTNRIRVYAGMNIHVIRTDQLDNYFGIKFGFKKSFIDYNTNDPADYSGFNFEVPVGLRVSYGFRYFINEYWGLHTEFGLGGPLVTFGLTHKLID
jgi:hypothetical protein